MVRAVKILRDAFVLWWDNSFLLLVFNLAWLILQIPIITGPPATAAIYSIGKQSVEQQPLEILDGWRALRKLFWPAWKWGLVNLVVLSALVFNLVSYSGAVGLGWTLLRYVWAAILLIWCVINFFYWPFWLYQSDRSMLTTLRNCFLLLARQPMLVMTLFILAVIIAIISVVLAIPLAFLLMIFLAMAGLITVRAELKIEKG